jgi:hypothetical protein
VLLGALAAAQAAAAPAAATCPAAWRAGWQRLANDVRAPVYCPSWMPHPLDARIGGVYSYGRFVERDRSYLVSFLQQENTPTTADEVHVNFRGYPGRTAIPTCEDTRTAGGKVYRDRVPCFSDANARRRVGGVTVTVYTVNQGVDQWHVLYAWRHAGSLYTLSEHVAPPYATYARVVANLDRTMRGLALLQPSRS